MLAVLGLVLRLPLEVSIAHVPVLQVGTLKSGDGVSVVGLESDEQG